MTDYNTLGNKVRAGMITFSKKISHGFSKPAQRFIADMLVGIIGSNSSKLTKIGRELKEDIGLKKTVERLGRNLSGFSNAEQLTANYLAAVNPFLGPDTMLLVDNGDVTKPCSPKMEGIGSVKDGSTGKFADGYWTIGAVALTSKSQQPIPVYEELYPCTKQGGAGFKVEASKCLQYLRENYESSIPRVFDRGFDASDVISELIDRDEKFILRVNQNRVVIHNGKRKYINDVVRGLVCENELIFNSKTGNKSKCKIGMTQVTLPRLNNIKLTLVACKEFGENPLVLYTNLPEPLEDLSVRIVKGFLMRWRIEEYHAFKKQGLNFEDFRVRSLNAIKTLDLLITIAVGYIGMLCDKKDSKLVLELINVSKRIPKLHEYMKMTKFFFYSVLDGITSVLSKLKKGISHFFLTPGSSNQLSIPWVGGFLG